MPQNIYQSKYSFYFQFFNIANISIGIDLTFEFHWISNAATNVTVFGS